MKLDSARELKQMLSGQMLERAAPMRIRAMGVRAMSVEALRAPQPTVALGVAPVKGGKDFKLAVRVQRRAAQDVGMVDEIITRARGEVDVRYIGRLIKRAPWYQNRQRPLLIGTSVGHHRVTAGTLACVVRKRDGSVRLLSNNHVFADENRGRAGDRIIQPGTADGGRAADRVGSLAEYVPLTKGRPNMVDAALAKPGRGIEHHADRLRGVGTLSGVVGAEWQEVDLVEKIGRTTGHTEGRVTGFELDNVVVEFEIGDLVFNDQIEIEGRDSGPFSRGGDSGSLVFTKADKQAFALLFAGGSQGGRNGRGLTYANPIRTVFRRLGVSLVR